ncbi:MAG: hypothetical protein WBA74_08125, partial [Cyclobacteriaceae bacterium]
MSKYILILLLWLGSLPLHAQDTLQMVFDMEGRLISEPPQILVKPGIGSVINVKVIVELNTEYMRARTKTAIDSYFTVLKSLEKNSRSLQLDYHLSRKTIENLRSIYLSRITSAINSYKHFLYQQEWNHYENNLAIYRKVEVLEYSTDAFEISQLEKYVPELSEFIEPDFSFHIPGIDRGMRNLEKDDNFSHAVTYENIALNTSEFHYRLYQTDNYYQYLENYYANPTDYSELASFNRQIRQYVEIFNRWSKIAKSSKNLFLRMKKDSIITAYSDLSGIDQKINIDENRRTLLKRLIEGFWLTGGKIVSDPVASYFNTPGANGNEAKMKLAAGKLRH